MGINWIQTNVIGGDNPYPDCADENRLVGSYPLDCVGVVVTEGREHYFTVDPSHAGEFMDWATSTFAKVSPATIERNGKDGYQVVVTVKHYADSPRPL